MSDYYVDEIDGVFFTDRTAATDEEFRSRVAPFEAADPAPESFRPLPGEIEMHRAMNATPEQVERLRATAAALAPQAGDGAR